LNSDLGVGVVEQVFSSKTMNEHDGLRRYSEISRREFYDGDLILNSENVSVVRTFGSDRDVD
jgi:hypothetical protein